MIVPPSSFSSTLLSAGEDVINGVSMTVVGVKPFNGNDVHSLLGERIRGAFLDRHCAPLVMYLSYSCASVVAS